MQYIEKNDNIEKVYDIFLDKEKLIELLNQIIKNVSYELEGTFTLPYNASVDYKNKIILSGAKLPNGMPQFKNIKKLYPITPNDAYSYYQDAIAVEGTQVIVPYLAYVIKRLLKGELHAVDAFLSYKDCDEMISIDEKIVSLDAEINKMDNYNPDKKIKLLNDLKKLMSDKESKHFFDIELLKSYYFEAYNYIELQLVSEKKLMNNSSKVLLKNSK